MISCAALVCAATAAAAADHPTNVILLIGDGMGPEQVKAGGMYAHGTAGTLSFESMPYQAQVTTYSADSSVTDSAAAATAIATGVKVDNGVISLAIPGDTSELETMLEECQDRGKAVGLVTTTAMTHATPAAFGAHEADRDYEDQIAADYLTQTRPNVLFGGGDKGMDVLPAMSAGYTVAENLAQMNALPPTSAYASGQFGGGHLPFELDGLGDLPHLSQMTAKALNLLESDPDGLFLMVEGGRIDHACHDNDIQRAVHEVAEFSDTVQVVLDWAAGRDDTLVLVTADHETGGLTVDGGFDPLGYPNVSWLYGGHSNANVPLYAWGVGAGNFAGVLDNTDLFALAIPEPIGGDANLDGAVTVGDLGILGANYGTPTGALWITGDFNDDGAVTVGDLGILGANYGTGAGALPEPTTLLLIAISGTLLLSRRRR